MSAQPQPAPNEEPEILIWVDGRWRGPVENPQIRADGWLAYGVTRGGRIRPGNWKNAPLKPAPVLAFRKPSSKPRLTYHPRLLPPASPRCFCGVCGGYFKDGDAFEAHRIKHGKCAVSDRERRNRGLKIWKVHRIDGREFVEWALA